MEATFRIRRQHGLAKHIVIHENCAEANRQQDAHRAGTAIGRMSGPLSSVEKKTQTRFSVRFLGNQACKQRSLRLLSHVPHFLGTARIEPRHKLPIRSA